MSSYASQDPECGGMRNKQLRECQGAKKHQPKSKAATLQTAVDTTRNNPQRPPNCS